MPTADRLQIFMSTIQRDFPSVAIGQIEAYPTFAPQAFQDMIALLQARNVAPAFLQIDVDMRGLEGVMFNPVADVAQLCMEICSGISAQVGKAVVNAFASV